MKSNADIFSLSSHHDLNQLASKFFRVFSRVEYSLKASGYHKGEGTAEVDWRSFAKVVQPLIEAPSDPLLKEAIDFLLESPPKKQEIRSGLLYWADSEPSTDILADKVLIYIRRVRNNLFHGGKFNDNWFAPERSEPLIKHSLVVLAACICQVDEVCRAYKG